MESCTLVSELSCRSQSSWTPAVIPRSQKQGCFDWTLISGHRFSAARRKWPTSSFVHRLIGNVSLSFYICKLLHTLQDGPATSPRLRRTFLTSEYFVLVSLKHQHLLLWGWQFTTCGSRPLWGGVSQIRHPANQIFTLWLTKMSMIQLGSNRKLILWFGVTKTWGTVKREYLVYYMDAPPVN